MNVKIISFSQAPEGWDGYDCQELIAYCARVSNPSNQMNTETSEKLIKYLIKNQYLVKGKNQEQKNNIDF